MNLIINVCKERLHYYEFVKPVESILKQSGIKFITKHYSEVESVEEYNKIIICGTSLKDNKFRKDSDIDLLLIVNKKIEVDKSKEYVDAQVGLKINCFQITYNEFLKEIEKFSWLKETNKKVLGICAGFQIMGLVYNGKLKKKTEIGFFNEEINILNVKGKVQVYHLHNNYVEFEDFEILSKGDIVQAVKKKNLYGVLFHPEVRNKEIIKNFLKL